MNPNPILEKKMESQIAETKYLATSFYRAPIIGDMRIFDTEKDARDWIAVLEAANPVKGCNRYRLWIVSSNKAPILIKV